MVKGNDIRKAVGLALRELRLERNISQEKLAELGGLDRSYVSEIENGDKTASVVTIFKVAIALDLKPSEFLQEVENYFNF